MDKLGEGRKQRSKNGGDEGLSTPARILSRKSSQRPRKVICVLVEDLYESLHFVERWDLDDLPMVSRQYRAVVERGTTTGNFQQRRMIDEIEHECYYEDSWFFIKGVANKNSRVLAHYAGGDYVVGSRNNTYGLNVDRLKELLKAVPEIRARRFIFSLTSKWYFIKTVAELGQLWEGGQLCITFNSNSTIYGRLCGDRGTAAAAIGHVLNSLSALSVSGGQWVDALLGFNSVAPIIRCPRLYIDFVTCRGFTFDAIVDYLFYSDGAANDGNADMRIGGKRELKIKRLEFSNGDLDSYSPLRFMQLLKKRLGLYLNPILTTTTRALPYFSLEIAFEYPKEKYQEGEFELVEVPSPQSLPTESITQLPPSTSSSCVKQLSSQNSCGHSCIFTSKRSGKDAHITVQCN